MVNLYLPLQFWICPKKRLLIASKPRAVVIMYQQPSASHEVIVVVVNLEIIDSLLTSDRRDGDDLAPVALDILDEIAHLHVAGFDPIAVFGLAALDPEGMVEAGPQEIAFAFDAKLQQSVSVRLGERRDGLVLQLAGRPVARENLVAHLDAFHRNDAALGVNRRSGGKAERKAAAQKSKSRSWLRAGPPTQLRSEIRCKKPEAQCRRILPVPCLFQSRIKSRLCFFH